jgi:hypothetical protein
MWNMRTEQQVLDIVSLLLQKQQRSLHIQSLFTKLSLVKITPLIKNQTKTLILRGNFNFHMCLFVGTKLLCI